MNNAGRITIGMAAGFVTIIVVYVLKLYQVDVPAEVGQAFTGLVTFTAGFFMKSPTEEK